MAIIDPVRRRTQAERIESTRRRLLDSAVETLVKDGMQGFSLGKVATRADMTTGAVQHHFESRSELLKSVITERLFPQDMIRLEPPQSQDLDRPQDLDRRCQQIVRSLWRYYDDPIHLVSWDILFGAKHDEALSEELRVWRRTSLRAVEQMLSERFIDLGLTKSQISDLQVFLIAQLRGLGLLSMLGTSRGTSRQLNLLSSALRHHVCEFARCSSAE